VCHFLVSLHETPTDNLQFPICDKTSHEAAIHSLFREIADLELVDGTELQLSDVSIDIGKIS
jgi:hypothetical protein